MQNRRHVAKCARAHECDRPDALNLTTSRNTSWACVVVIEFTDTATSTRSMRCIFAALSGVYFLFIFYALVSTDVLCIHTYNVTNTDVLSMRRGRKGKLYAWKGSSN